MGEFDFARGDRGSWSVAERCGGLTFIERCVNSKGGGMGGEDARGQARERLIARVDAKSDCRRG